MNENLWPSSIDLNDKIVTPKQILDDQALFVSKLTSDVLFAELKELSKILDSIMEDFYYGFFIKSRFMDDYSYRVFTIAYNISMYPLYISLDSDIANELQLDLISYEIKNEKELLENLKKIFSSNKLQMVLKNLYKMSR